MIEDFKKYNQYSGNVYFERVCAGRALKNSDLIIAIWRVLEKFCYSNGS